MDILLWCGCRVDIVCLADIPADILLWCAPDIAQRTISNCARDYSGSYFVVMRLSRYTAT